MKNSNIEVTAGFHDLCETHLLSLRDIGLWLLIRSWCHAHPEEGGRVPGMVINAFILPRIDIHAVDEGDDVADRFVEPLITLRMLVREGDAEDGWYRLTGWPSVDAQAAASQVPATPPASASQCSPTRSTEHGREANG